MAKSNLVLIEKWEDATTKYILLGDRETRGASYAELQVIRKESRS